MHDLAGGDLLWLGIVEHGNYFIQGADPRIDAARFDPGHHGLADPCPSCNLGLAEPQCFAAGTELFRSGGMHMQLLIVIEKYQPYAAGRNTGIIPEPGNFIDPDRI